MIKVLVAAAAMALASPAAAQLSLERVGDFIPLEPAFLEAGPLFAYTDLAAYNDGARARDRLVGIPRALHPLAVQPLGTKALRAVLGVDAPAIGRVLDFGRPPQQVLLLAGEPAMAELAAVAAALGGRGFAKLREGERVVWHRGEDGNLDMSLREPADPFGGDFGRSARIAVRSGEMVGAADWATLRRTLAAIDGTAPSFADLPDFAAALNGAGTMAAERGLAVLQATGFHIAQTGFLPPDFPIDGSQEDFVAAARRAMEHAAAADVLPPYTFAVLADLSGSAGDAAAVALSYPDAALAGQARDILVGRLEAGAAGSVEGAVVDHGPAGAAWAAVVLVAPAAGAPTPYREWIDQIMRRDFGLIALEP